MEARRSARRYAHLLGVTALSLSLACEETPISRDAATVNDGTSAPEAAVVDRGSGGDFAAGDGLTKPRDATTDSGSQTYTCKNPDPAWLLCDDFEGLSAGIDAWFTASGWTDAIGKGNAGRIKASTAAHGGKYALHMPAAASAGYQGADLIWRSCSGTNKPGCKLKGHPQLYLRAYVKLAADHKLVHHFLNVGGGPVSDYWAPFGNAGCRPNGKRAMGTTVDFKKNTHETFFYTYHPSMKCDPGANCQKYADPTKICSDCAKKNMPCTNGLECCWGNSYQPTPAVALPLGKWFCFEMMMRPNDVGSKNGEMAFWIDGALAHQVKNMHWRDVPELQMNKARLQHYITTSDAAGHSNQAFFDDVVISEKRIGCK